MSKQWSTKHYRKLKIGSFLICLFDLSTSVHPQSMGNVDITIIIQNRSLPQQGEGLNIGIFVQLIIIIAFYPQPFDSGTNFKSNVSVNSMKLFLNNTINPVPSYFYAGSRIGQILHTRIRTESSALKDHLYKKHIEANPYCSCKLVETSEHFLLKCSLQERL